MAHALDRIATQIFEKAIATGQAGELLECLFEGGSATIDRLTGRLVMVPGAAIISMGGD